MGEKALNDKDHAYAADRGEMLLNQYNWPFPWWRIAYHSIKVEIPPERRALMRWVYLLWWSQCGALALNFWLWLFFFFGGGDIPGDASPTMTVLISLVFWLFGTVFSWRWWYRSLYYAFRDVGKPRKFIWFFMHFIVHILWSIFFVIGAPSCAVWGIIAMSD